MDTQGEILFTDTASATGAFANVLITIAAGEPSQQTMQRARSAHVTLRDRYPKGYAHLLVTAATARMPNADQRAEMQKTTRDFSPHMIAHAIVLEGDGLIAASFRMVTQTMLLAVPKAHPHRAFGRVEDAALWVHDQCQKVVQFDVFALEQFVRELRRHA